MIVGQPGSGKSSLARALGERTGLPVVHIDKIHWQPGWIERSREEKTRLCREAEAGKRWIFEGGHSLTWPSRLARAEMLVWLDRPAPDCGPGACSAGRSRGWAGPGRTWRTAVPSGFAPFPNSSIISGRRANPAVPRSLGSPLRRRPAASWSGSAPTAKPPHSWPASRVPGVRPRPERYGCGQSARHPGCRTWV